MTPEQWQRVEDLLQRALDCPPQERTSFLDEACAGDEQLREEATSLVNAYDEAGDFIEQPALAQDARVLVGDGADQKIGCAIGPYKIIERLGAGGMGEVYLAADARLERLVALKILPTYFASDDTRLRRFQREARAASGLNHPNILTIHEVGESDGVYFIATEFIDGQTIRELVRNQKLSLEEVLDIAAQVASALSAAHAAGIVHRDIKPENIMQRTDGLVKILDFGIAKLMEPNTPDHSNETQSIIRTHTEAGLVMGTVNYMSPEQARALPVDERTDIWSLGVVFYEMLTKRLPFTGATRMDTMVAILDREPPPLSEVTDDLYPGMLLAQKIVNKCLCKDVNERYGAANELLGELKIAREQVNGDLPAATIPRPVQDAGHARETTALSSYVWFLSALVLLLAATAMIALYHRSAPRPPATAVSDGTATTGKLYSQMSAVERLNFVDAQEQRISTMMGDRPVKLNEDAVRVIKAYVDRYAALNGSADLDSESMSMVY